MEWFQRSYNLRLNDYRVQLFTYAGFIVASAVAVTTACWSYTPVSIRFLSGVVSFGLSPGFLLLLFINLRKERNLDPATMFLTVVSLSFSLNFLFNILLFLTGSSFKEMTHIYIYAQVFAYILIFVGLRLRPGWFPSLRQGLSLSLSPVEVYGFSFLTLGFMVLLYGKYITGSQPVNPEEIVVLRKLAENPSVLYNNISAFAGQPSTYLFVPFQVLIVGVSIVSGLDVSLVYSMFWSFTTALSILCLVKLVHVLFGSGTATFIMAGICLTISLFNPMSVIYGLGIMTPYPNRYGFSGGVLIPLNLLMFWSILREKDFKFILMALLIYLTVEMTFVHARETLFVLGCMVVTGLLLIKNFNYQRNLLYRVFLTVGVGAIVLLIYKVTNLAVSLHLSEYVGLLTLKTKEALYSMIEQNGLLRSLFVTGPSEVVIRWEHISTAFVTHVASYREIFVESWSTGDYPGRLVLPLCLLGFPFYIYRARSLIEVILPACITLSALVSSSGLIKMALASLVGNPEVLISYNIVFILAFAILSHMLSLIVPAISSLLDGPRRKTVLTLLAIGVALAFFPSIWYNTILRSLRWLWEVPFFAPAWHLATLSIIIVRVFTANLPLFPEGTSSKGPSLNKFIAGLAVLAVLLIPVALKGKTGKQFSSKWSPSKFKGDFYTDYELLVKGNKFSSSLPLKVISFLRDELPPNQTVIGRDTYTVAMNSTHYVAILASAGDKNIPAYYISNWQYLTKYQVKEGPFSLKEFLTLKDNYKALKDMLSGLRIDVVMVDPTESETVKLIWDKDRELQKILAPVFSEEDYIIFRVEM